MNSTTITLSTYLANVQIQVIRSLLTTTLVIGNLSNLANIFVFFQGSLRSHICSWYFIGVSAGYLLYLNMGCLTRVIAAWTRYDRSTVSLPFCKARIFFVLLGLTIARYLLCLICIDRWMVTSRNATIRRQSSPKIARLLIIGGSSILIVINILVSVGYTISQNQCGPSAEPTYSLFYTIYNTVLAFGPLFILITFSILVLINIRQPPRHQISPDTQTYGTSEVQNRVHRFRKKDIQFIKLSLAQVAGYVLCNTLHGYNALYGVITQYNVKTADQRAIEAFVNGMDLNLHYFYTGITFFLYTLASITFRREFIRLWKQWSQRLLHLGFHQTNH